MNNNPQYTHSENAIGLTDLWIIAIKHKKVFWYVFCTSLLIGLLVAYLTPNKYLLTTTISIGKTIQNGKETLLESPETVKAKLENALIPITLEQYDDKNIKPVKFNISIPNSSNLVILQTKAPMEEINQHIQIHTSLIKAIAADHEIIIKPIRANILESIQQKQLELKQQQDTRFLEPAIKELELKAKEAEINLLKLEDPTIQEYKLKGLETQLQNKKNQLHSLSETASFFEKRKERLVTLSNLLTHQIDEVKKQISEALKHYYDITSENNNGAQMLVFLTKNELQQNRTHLATLEERLYIDLENQQSSLQKDINDNARQQAELQAEINKQQMNLEIYRVENKLDIETRISEIAQIKAQQIKLPATQEKNIELIKQQITALNEKLTNDLIVTGSITSPVRSQTPVGTSKGIIILSSGILGIMLGFFSSFISEFFDKVSVRRLEET